MIINLTPHVIRLNDGREFPPSGSIARVSTKREFVGWYHEGQDGTVTLDDEMLSDAIPIYKTVFGDVVGLPEPQNGTIYLVSGMVASACLDRMDVLSPATGDGCVRKDGNVYSVPGFTK